MSGGKTSVPPEFGQLAARAYAMLNQTAPARKLALGQLTEAMRTGGVRAKIPLIQQAVSASNQATSRALTDTSASLANRNVGGPFAANILASQRLQGAQATAAIPTSIAERVIGQTMPFLSTTQGLGAGGLSQAGQADFASDAFNAQQYAKLMEDIKSSLVSSGQGAAMCLHPDARIETPSGSKPVKDFVPGDPVWTLDRYGKRMRGFVTQVGKRLVRSDHRMLKVEAPGGPFLVSLNHPLPDGRPITAVLGGTILTRMTDYTCDIAVDGPTGVYFVNGFPLGSTLDERNFRVEAA
jgi:hypothetical protein